MAVYLDIIFRGLRSDAYFDFSRSLNAQECNRLVRVCANAICAVCFAAPCSNRVSRSTALNKKTWHIWRENPLPLSENLYQERAKFIRRGFYKLIEATALRNHKSNTKSFYRWNNFHFVLSDVIDVPEAMIIYACLSPEITERKTRWLPDYKTHQPTIWSSACQLFFLLQHDSWFFPSQPFAKMTKFMNDLCCKLKTVFLLNSLSWTHAWTGVDGKGLTYMIWEAQISVTEQSALN